MSEQILTMSGDFDRDFEAYQQYHHDNIEAVEATIVECGTVHCTGLGC